MSEAGNQVKMWPVRARRARRALAHLRRDESGAGTVFALFWMMLCFLMAGFAVDGTNAWRNQQQLQQTADVAAHAGVIRLTRGDDLASVRQTAIDAIALNMPQSVFGPLIADADQDVRLVHYDPATNRVNAAGPVNAVSVTLHRDESVGNSVRTFMLRLASLATRGQVERMAWNMQVTGVAAVLPLASCSGMDGVYAEGVIHTTSSQYIGKGYCLYSKNHVWMPQRTTFEEGAGVGMPDLEDCRNKCTDQANPGSEAARFEANLQLPNISAMMTETQAAFTDSDTGEMDARKAAIFGEMEETGDLSPLSGLADTAALDLGDTVTLTEAEFESLAAIPEGLTYNVTCSGGGGGNDGGGSGDDGGDDDTSGNGKGGGKDKSNGGGNNGGGGKKGELSLDETNGADGLKNVALITDCKLHFGKGADVTASLIMTTNTDSSGAISASPQARVGAAGNVCNPEARTTIMSAGGMHVPAAFSGSNITFVVDGDISFAGSSAQGDIHYGASYYATGSVHLAAGHTLLACEEEPDPFAPEFTVIRHVAPR